MHTVTLAARLISPHTIGVTISLLDHPTPIQQFVSTIDMSYKSLRGILVRLGNRLGLTEQTSTLKPSHMSGPLGMGLVLFNSVRSASLISGIYFVVVISFALAIFNLFPLPVLDGGHILFGLIEIVFRRPLPVVVVKSALHHLRHTADQPDALRHLLRRKKNLLFDLPERDDVPTATESAGEKTHVNPTPNQP
ncbi:MAG: site-2 protease family protein [Lentisphaeria bacterium]|nr:MAG: site-2 protease family protein [Lentisphaeria bacterium]